jgi:hypothetical protein
MQILQNINKLLEKWGDWRINRATRLIASVPEGAALLELAQKEGFGFKFRPSITFTALGNLRNGAKDPDDKTEIQLNIFLPRKQMVRTMAHELRHLWQMRNIGDHRPMNSLSFDRAAGLIRLIEGDAFVFENYLMTKIAKATGISLPVSNPAGTAPADTTEGMRQRFDHFQRSNIAQLYDKNVLRLFNKVAGWADAKARPLADVLRSRFNRSSYDGIAGIGTMPVIAGQPYLGGMGADAVGDHIWAQIKTPAMLAARQRFTA